MEKNKVVEAAVVLGAGYGAGKLANWMSENSFICTFGGIVITGVSLLGYFAYRDIIKNRARILPEVKTINWTLLRVLELEEIHENGDEDAICTICHNRLIDIEMRDDPLEDRAVVKMPDCVHKFHRSCAMDWLKTQQDTYRVMYMQNNNAGEFEPCCSNCRTVVTSMLTTEAF